MLRTKLTKLPCPLALVLRRKFAISMRRKFKVAVIGGAGGIGQPLSMLLKRNPLVTELNIFDVAKHTLGVAKDLSHIDTNCEVKGFSDCDLAKSLECAHIVVMPAGVARKPGMSRDDLFTTNAELVKEVTEAVAKSCPKALFAIITNPINSVIPIAAETLKKAKVFDPNRLFGISTLDAVRARTFVAEILCIDPKKVDAIVIGGHSGDTIIPVLSQFKPELKADKDTIEKLTKRIQNAGTEVVKAKAGAGSATLSTAEAAHQFVTSLMKGLKGEDCIKESAYVASKATKAAYFSTPFILGKDGIKQHLGLPELNEYEKKLLETALCELQKNIKVGVDFVKGDDKCDK